MPLREKLLYMVVGGGLVIVGHVLLSFLPSKAKAQRPTEQTTFERVVCTGLTVLDAAGIPRVSLLPGEEGGVVAVFGQDGVARSVIGADEHGGTVIVSDASGKPRAAIRVTSSGGVLMTLSPTGTKQSLLGASPTGGELTLHALDGQLRGAFVVLENGAVLSAHGNDGQKRVILGVDPSGQGSIQTYNNDGKRSGGLPPIER